MHRSSANPTAVACVAAYAWLVVTLPANAASSFNARAAITYTVSNIVNQTNPGDLGDLQLRGYFRQAPQPDSVYEINGNGSVTDNNPDVGPIAVSDTFSHEFSVSGQLLEGTLLSSHLGHFELEFTNSGAHAYTYRVELSLSYLIEATVSGENANASVFLDYFDSAQELTGFDSAIADLYVLPSASQNGESDVLTFQLSANQSRSLYADARIESRLETSPVPLPAAAWLLVSGLVTLGSRARLNPGGRPSNPIAQSD